MSYGSPSGIRRPWAWDCPTIFQSPGVALALNPPIQDMVASAPGQWSNCRLTVCAPEAWIDVVFELWVRVGRGYLPIRRATIRGSSPEPSGGDLSATLFHVCGWPCDQFVVRARAAARELTNLEASLLCWGEEQCDHTMVPAHIQTADGAPSTLITEPVTPGQVLVSRPTMARSAYGNLLPTAAATRFVMFFDTLAVPPGPPPNTAPFFSSIPVIPGGIWSWAPAEGVQFTAGVAVGLSNTWDVWTPSADTFTATLFFDP